MLNKILQRVCDDFCVDLLVPSTQEHNNRYPTLGTNPDESFISSDDAISRDLHSSERVSIKNVSSSIVDHKLGLKLIEIVVNLLD